MRLVLKTPTGEVNPLEHLPVVLGAQEIKFVRNLLTELGRLDFVPLCEQGPGPHQQPLIDFLRTVFAGRTRDEWEPLSTIVAG
jgi:hypothetical protein